MDAHKNTPNQKRDQRLGLLGRAVIITPAGAGGLGDQAMLDVAAQELIQQGYSVSLLPNPTSIRASVTQLSIKGGIKEKLRIVATMLRARRVIVIGADIIDGGYGATQILRRLRLARLASLFGGRTRVIGSSFSANPNPDVIAFIKEANWLEIFAREPLSQQRMEQFLGRKVTMVADSAFLLRPEISCDVAKAAMSFMSEQKAKGRRIICLNASGLVFTKIAPGALERFSTTIADWIARTPDIVPIVLAHDRRPGKAGDLESCDVLAAAVKDKAPERCYYVRENISAWDVKALAAQFDMALVCRMHLAIACLGQSVPPLSLVSMGKFEGLMLHFGLQGLTLDPATVAGDMSTLTEALNNLSRRAPALRDKIQDALAAVRALSEKNYEHL
ncbi:polysaccharide pyruvyl transferase family protein [Thioalkalivibrio sp. XN279]|uniref:polysaccharide pyruvyl transferase family protein n=1 Tax=Thioalkalivibrio sp. XN279 TaxID=2714953 RepID=UPI001407F9A1|nr:polysaccharide pyruvyl transferase family protein [Thioalkalivibrio sp. XN279]NHA15352.1 hypothetical protein [Thioalkalivibrio sp. XN279]